MQFWWNVEVYLWLIAFATKPWTTSTWIGYQKSCRFYKPFDLPCTSKIFVLHKELSHRICNKFDWCFHHHCCWKRKCDLVLNRHTYNILDLDKKRSKLCSKSRKLIIKEEFQIYQHVPHQMIKPHFVNHASRESILAACAPNIWVLAIPLWKREIFISNKPSLKVLIYMYLHVGNEAFLAIKCR